MSPQMLEEALMLPKQSIDLEVGERNVMSVTVPSFEFNASENSDSDIYSYGFVATSGELDDSVAAVKMCCRTCWSWHRLKKAHR